MFKLGERFGALPESGGLLDQSAEMIKWLEIERLGGEQ